MCYNTPIIAHLPENVNSKATFHRLAQKNKPSSRLVLFKEPGAGRENRTLISSLENSHTNHCTIPAYCNMLAIYVIKSFRSVFSPSEARFVIERARKNAEMGDFSRKWGGIAGSNRRLPLGTLRRFQPRCTRAGTFAWGGIAGSNRRPSGPQSDALTI